MNITGRKKTFTVKIAIDEDQDNFLTSLKNWTSEKGYTFVSLEEVMFESEWDVIVKGAQMLQAFYPKNSLGWLRIQRLVDRYENGERSDKLKEELEKSE